MRLAVFTSNYPARVATFFERDMRALHEAGIELEVFAVRAQQRELWRYSLDILNREHLPRQRVHHLTWPRAMMRAARGGALRRAMNLRDAASILAAAARFGPAAFAKTACVLPKGWAWTAGPGPRIDHVLAYWGNYAGTCAYVFHRMLNRRIPFSIWLHAGADLYKTPVFLREKLRYADNIITCCEFNRGYIRQHFGKQEPDITSRIHVCHHGLDLRTFPFRPSGRPADRVVAVGRLADHKGFDHLLRATHLLLGRGVDVKVDLVGDGPQRRALESMVVKLGLRDSVRFLGWLPFPAASSAMASATLLVHPSDELGDGLPNVVREAMALGTPVIGSRVAGIPDALNERCGVLVPPGDAVALADAIQRLLADPEQRIDIARRARRRVEENFDLWRNGRRLAGLLRQTRRRADRGAPSRAVPLAGQAALGGD